MAKKLSKRQQSIQKLIEPQKKYDILEAIELLQTKIQKPKFDESCDISINLGVDPKKSDQTVRGVCDYPHGTGKSVRVAVFAQGAQAEKAKLAGADLVGFADLAESIQGGNFNFDILIAEPSAMAMVGKLGQILGPKGLMPNPKVGTVTSDVAQAVQKAKAGQVQFRTDKAGIVHATCGKISFSKDKLKENIDTLLVAVKKLKPNSSKGVYIKKITISSTMGPGLSINPGSLALVG